jgi:hypothetical protein
MPLPTLSRFSWTAIAVIGAVAIISTVIVLSIHHLQPIPQKEQYTIDSLKATQPAYQALRDTLIQRETLYVRRVDTLLVQAKHTIATADTAHRRADSLAVIAQQSHDSSSQWKSAYDARTVEADTLRHALSLSFAAESTEHQARLSADLRATNAEQRLTALNDLSSRLAIDLQRATECKFLWMHCPSRKAVAITTFIGGVVADRFVPSRKP